jgi:hypothetical protein
MSIMEARVIHASIARPWQDVYAFAADPLTMSRWASGLSDGLRRDGDAWLTSGPLGEARVRFAPPNDFGVIDHLVTMPDGRQVNNAMRVVANGDGAEVMFLLLRQPSMSDADFERDAQWVMKDLRTLKELMEGDDHG